MLRDEIRKSFEECGQDGAALYLLIHPDLFIQLRNEIKDTTIPNGGLLGWTEFLGKEPLYEDDDDESRITGWKDKAYHISIVVSDAVSGLRVVSDPFSELDRHLKSGRKKPVK